MHLLGPVAGRGRAAGASRPASTARACSPTGRAARDAKVRAAYDAVARRTPTSSATSSTASPSTAGCSTASPALAGGGPVADVGTGPGHVAAYLAAAGADVTGVDLSPGMVEEARRRFPDLTFAVGDLTSLLRPPAASGWGAITAWYALVHLAGSELGPAVASLARVLAPGGWLALALHAGDEVRHVDELWSSRSTSTSCSTTRPTCSPRCARPGWSTSSGTCAARYAGAEVETERLYVLGRRPAGSAAAQRRSCISSSRSTPRKPSASFTAFMAALTPATAVKT